MAQGDVFGSVKRTYRLSAETSKQFEILVPAGKRSQVIEQLLVREIETNRRESLRESIATGLVEMAEVYQATSSEWEVTEVDGWPTQ